MVYNSRMTVVDNYMFKIPRILILNVSNTKRQHTIEKMDILVILI